MNESVILVVDYEKICRLCLQATGAMTDIFEHSEGTLLQKLVLSATGLEVQINDGLPSKICHKCRYVVELSCELRDMAGKSHLLLTEADNYLDKEYLEQEEKLPETPIQDSIPTSHRPTELKLVLQDDGMLTLVKNEPLTPVDVQDKPFDFATEESKQKHASSTPKIRKAPPKHLTCQICLASFPTSEEVSSHVPMHYLDSNLTPYLELKRPYKCEACNSGVISKTKLIIHHRNHLNVNPFICKHPGCEFIGKNKEALRLHCMKHGPISHVCEACGLVFRRRWELCAHRARSHAAAPQRCRSCQKQFSNQFTYRAHQMLHHRAPRHACKWAGCTKAYHSRFALTAHARSHSGHRAYRCHLCDAAAYTTQSLLNRHLRMHERARMSKCDKCAATFTDYGAFYRHRVSEHGPWQPHRCVGCNKGYQMEDKLNTHMETCEQAIRMKSVMAVDNANSEDILVSSIQEIIQTDNTTYQQAQASEQLSDKFKGQSLLVQPGNIHDLSKGLVLQELPPDGLLYIEVD